MAVSFHSGESEIKVETHIYQKFPKTEAQEAVANRTSQSKLRYLSVVLVSFGLLCVLQVILNISLRLALSSADSSAAVSLSHQTPPNEPVPTTGVGGSADSSAAVSLSPQTPPNEPVPTTGVGGSADSSAAVSLSPQTPPNEPVPTTGVGEENHCLQNWQTFGTSCYYISSEGKSWDQSREYCREREADLVIINSREEQDFLMRLNEAAWVGMTDRDEEGSWKWVDGTPVASDRLYWAPGQPDDAFGGEDCGDIRNMINFIGLNDFSCRAISHWICEKTL